MSSPAIQIIGIDLLNVVGNSGPVSRVRLWTELNHNFSLNDKVFLYEDPLFPTSLDNTVVSNYGDYELGYDILSTTSHTIVLDLERTFPIILSSWLFASTSIFKGTNSQFNGSSNSSKWEGGIFGEGDGTCIYNGSNSTWDNGIFVNGTWEEGTWKSFNSPTSIIPQSNPILPATPTQIPSGGYSFLWGYNIFVNGTWEEGTWNNGRHWNGEWVTGTWNNGYFQGGVWENGIWENGIMSSNKHLSLWKKGKWINGNNIDVIKYTGEFEGGWINPNFQYSIKFLTYTGANVYVVETDKEFENIYNDIFLNTSSPEQTLTFHFLKDYPGGPFSDNKNNRRFVIDPLSGSVSGSSFFFSITDTEEYLGNTSLSGLDYSLAKLSTQAHYAGSLKNLNWGGSNLGHGLSYYSSPVNSFLGNIVSFDIGPDSNIYLPPLFGNGEFVYVSGLLLDFGSGSTVADGWYEIENFSNTLTVTFDIDFGAAIIGLGTSGEWRNVGGTKIFPLKMEDCIFHSGGLLSSRVINTTVKSQQFSGSMINDTKLTEVMNSDIGSSNFVFDNGIFRSGIWRNGNFNNGIFTNLYGNNESLWIKGNFNNGIFKNGFALDITFFGGEYENGCLYTSIFRGGSFNAGKDSYTGGLDGIENNNLSSSPRVLSVEYPGLVTTDVNHKFQKNYKVIFDNFKKGSGELDYQYFDIDSIVSDKSFLLSSWSFVQGDVNCSIGQVSGTLYDEVNDIIWVSDSKWNRVWRIDNINGSARMWGPENGSAGPGVGSLIPSEAKFNNPTKMTFGPLGDVYILDENNYSIQKIDILTDEISIFYQHPQQGTFRGFSYSDVLGKFAIIFDESYPLAPSLFRISVIGILETTISLSPVTTYAGDVEIDGVSDIAYILDTKLGDVYEVTTFSGIGILNPIPVLSTSLLLSTRWLAFKTEIFVSYNSQIYSGNPGGPVSLFAGSGNGNFDDQTGDPLLSTFGEIGPLSWTASGYLNVSDKGNNSNRKIEIGGSLNTYTLKTFWNGLEGIQSQSSQITCPVVTSRTFNSGDFYSGEFNGKLGTGSISTVKGNEHSGHWIKGTFHNGVWYNGTFSSTKEINYFKSGVWEAGRFRNGWVLGMDNSIPTANSYFEKGNITNSQNEVKLKSWESYGTDGEIIQKIQNTSGNVYRIYFQEFDGENTFEIGDIIQTSGLFKEYSITPISFQDYPGTNKFSFDIPTEFNYYQPQDEILIEGASFQGIENLSHKVNSVFPVISFLPVSLAARRLLLDKGEIISFSGMNISNVRISHNILHKIQNKGTGWIEIKLPNSISFDQVFRDTLPNNGVDEIYCTGECRIFKRSFRKVSGLSLLEIKNSNLKNCGVIGGDVKNSTLELCNLKEYEFSNYSSSFALGSLGTGRLNFTNSILNNSVFEAGELFNSTGKGVKFCSVEKFIGSDLGKWSINFKEGNVFTSEEFTISSIVPSASFSDIIFTQNHSLVIGDWVSVVGLEDSNSSVYGSAKPRFWRVIDVPTSDSITISNPAEFLSVPLAAPGVGTYTNYPVSYNTQNLYSKVSNNSYSGITSSGIGTKNYLSGIFNSCKNLKNSDVFGVFLPTEIGKVFGGNISISNLGLNRITFNTGVDNPGFATGETVYLRFLKNKNNIQTQGLSSSDIDSINGFYSNVIVNFSVTYQVTFTLPISIPLGYYDIEIVHSFNSQSEEIVAGGFEYLSLDNYATIIPQQLQISSSTRVSKGIWISGTMEGGSFSYENNPNIIASGDVLWMGGIWKSGSFYHGTWEGGEWNSVDEEWNKDNNRSIWINPDRINIIWKECIWNRGTWNGGKWLRGEWNSLDLNDVYNQNFSTWNSGEWRCLNSSGIVDDANFFSVWNGGKWFSIPTQSPGDGILYSYQGNNNYYINHNTQSGNYLKNAGESVWIHGTWKRGTWYGGTFYGGDWESIDSLGNFSNSQSTFTGGSFLKGDWYGGYWYSNADSRNSDLTEVVVGYNPLVSRFGGSNYEFLHFESFPILNSDPSSIVTETLYGRKRHDPTSSNYILRSRWFRGYFTGGKGEYSSFYSQNTAGELDNTQSKMYKGLISNSDWNGGTVFAIDGSFGGNLNFSGVKWRAGEWTGRHVSDPYPSTFENGIWFCGTFKNGYFKNSSWLSGYSTQFWDGINNLLPSAGMVVDGFVISPSVQVETKLFSLEGNGSPDSMPWFGGNSVPAQILNPGSGSIQFSLTFNRGTNNLGPGLQYNLQDPFRKSGKVDNYASRFKAGEMKGSTFLGGIFEDGKFLHNQSEIGVWTRGLFRGGYFSEDFNSVIGDYRRCWFMGLNLPEISNTSAWDTDSKIGLSVSYMSSIIERTTTNLQGQNFLTRDPYSSVFSRDTINGNNRKVSVMNGKMMGGCFFNLWEESFGSLASGFFNTPASKSAWRRVPMLGRYSEWSSRPNFSTSPVTITNASTIFNSTSPIPYTWDSGNGTYSLLNNPGTGTLNYRPVYYNTSNRSFDDSFTVSNWYVDPGAGGSSRAVYEYLNNNYDLTTNPLTSPGGGNAVIIDTLDI